MYKKIAAIFHAGQVVLSAMVILIGITYSIRCLFDGQIFCATCFAILGYVSGYRLLFKASVRELREFKANSHRP